MSRSFAALCFGFSVFSISALLADSSDDQMAPSSQSNTGQPVYERGSCFDQGSQPDTKIWGNAEYLLWWTKNGPLHTPLITTGSSSDPVPAAIGQPNTKVLFGNHSINFHGQSGFRLALRTWFEEDNEFAIEASGFYLPKKTKHTLDSSIGRHPIAVLGVPFNNVAPLPLPAGSGGWRGLNSGETALLAADGSSTFGTITTYSSTQLWGVELNGLWNFVSYDTFKLSALFGALYLDLQETLNLKFSSQFIDDSDEFFTFVTIIDKFRTHNEFYAGQLGLRGEWSQDWVFFNFVAKLGLGQMRNVVHINGFFADSNPVLYHNYGNGPSGIFAQPTNIGKHHKSDFALAPEFIFRFGINLIKNLRVSVGYDFLYITEVVRPGKQIDRSINETQAGPDSNHGIPLLTGPARPKPLRRTSDYWAQGINIGFEYRF